MHASLLPKYRGAAPIQWSVINGEKKTGVTTMLMDKGLDTGDMLVVKKQPTANNGDIVVALVDGEATVKRFYKKKNYFLLHPENSQLDDIVVLKLDILGVVVGLVRKYA